MHATSAKHSQKKLTTHHWVVSFPLFHMLLSFYFASLFWVNNQIQIFLPLFGKEKQVMLRTFLG